MSAENIANTCDRLKSKEVSHVEVCKPPLSAELRHECNNLLQVIISLLSIFPDHLKPTYYPKIPPNLTDTLTDESVISPLKETLYEILDYFSERIRELTGSDDDDAQKAIDIAQDIKNYASLALAFIGENPTLDSLSLINLIRLAQQGYQAQLDTDGSDRRIFFTFDDTLEAQQFVSTQILIEFCSILQNLLTNAIKYGVPSDPAALDDLYHIEIALSQNIDDGLIVLSVASSGDEIVDAMKDKLFHRLFRQEAHIAHQPGQGLGLHILNESVKALGGEIHIKWRPDTLQNVFYVSLPDTLTIRQAMTREHSSSSDRLSNSTTSLSPPRRARQILRLSASSFDELAYKSDGKDNDTDNLNNTAPMITDKPNNTASVIETITTNILVVDDDSVSGGIIARLLSTFTVGNVVHAVSFEQAVTLASENAPDLIISDFNTEETFRPDKHDDHAAGPIDNGEKFLDYLTQQLGIPGILISGNDLSEATEYSFCRKPILLDALRTCVKTTLSKTTTDTTSASLSLLGS